MNQYSVATVTLMRVIHKKQGAGHLKVSPSSAHASYLTPPPQTSLVLTAPALSPSYKSFLNTVTVVTLGWIGPVGTFRRIFQGHTKYREHIVFPHVPLAVAQCCSGFHVGSCPFRKMIDFCIYRHVFRFTDRPLTSTLGINHWSTHD